MLITAFALIWSGAANAQTELTRLAWAGQSNGAVAGFDTPQQACESNQNQYIPAFGRQVGTLASLNPAPDTMDAYAGVKVPAYDCHYDSGSGYYDTIRSLQGCTNGFKLVQGACLPASYAVTAEPVCDDGCKGVPGQYPAVGDPVSLATGTKVEAVTDYSSGGPYPIEIKRYYRSLNMPRDESSVGFGLAWRINLAGRKARKEWGGDNVVVSREDGIQTRFLNTNGGGTYGLPYGTDWTPYSIEKYYRNGSEYVQGQGDAKDRFRRMSVSTYEYQDEQDRIDVLEGNYFEIWVVKTRWRGGYERNYSYAPDDSTHSRPIQISDSLGRVVNITWDGNLISEVALPDGTRLQYSYEARAADGDVPSAAVLTQVTRRKADGTLIDSKGYQYGPAKSGTQVPLLSAVIDATGKTIDSTTYDSIGRVLTAQGPGGANAVSIAYDDQAGKRTVTNALGQVEIYTAEKSGLHYYGDPDTSLMRITSRVRQASATVPAASWSLTYGFGEFIRTDWNGVVTKETYDAYQNPTQRIEDFNGLKRTTTTTWSPAFHLPTQIVSPNLTVNFTYDTAGRLTRREEVDTINARQPVTRAWTYTWNSVGLMTSVTGPRTDVVQTTTYTYDAYGNLATVKDALNRVTTINAVNASGLPTSVTDQNGVVTLLTYDALGRIATTSVQGPVAATTSFTYDLNGLLTSVTSPANVTLTYGYDDAHRLNRITDSLGNSMVFALDGLGNRIQTQVQSGTAQVLMNNGATFDSLGRLLTGIGATNQTTRYEYDNNGNLTKLIDPRNATTLTAFDALNRVKQVTDALNGVTKTAYDLRDNVTSVTDPRLHATTYAVNGFGFVTSTTSPDNGTTTFTYDLAGNVKSRTDARKIVTNYTWDALDRPLTRTFPSATTENVTFVYDATAGGNFGVGRMTSVTDAAGTASFVYDAYGNRFSEMRTIAGIAYNTGYGYDLAGNLTRITYPSGLVVNYQRDGRGQVSGVTIQANAAAAATPIASNIGYMPFGGMRSATLGNGVQITNGYDLDYRLASIQASGATTLQNLTLGYDPAGNVNGITDAVAANLSQTFQYDLLGHVTKGTGAFGTDNYTYDAMGNRLTRSLVNGTTASTTYTYTTANTRLASAATGSSTLSYTYDALGSVTARKLGNTTQAAYTYNADARLATAGGAAYKYNAFGQRQSQTVTGGGTHFLFGPDGVLLAEHNVQGGLVRNYIYLNGRPMAVVDATGAVSYILNDHLGQPQKMLNAAGAVTWHRVAGVYGDTVSQPVGTTAANPIRFPGQQQDAVTGLYYNYFRDYDPATGRYLETDPIGLNGGINPYVYAGANPINLTDPDGRNPIAIAIGACRLFPSACVAAGTAAVSGICYVTGACQALGNAIQNAAEGSAGSGAQAGQGTQKDCPEDCQPLYEQINSAVRELQRRNAELIENRLNLPPTGRMSVGGHQHQMAGVQNRLRRLLNVANTRGCTGYRSDAWFWASKPIPGPQ
ncbi:MAG TPA: RHS repeat-associated core domain-containing protein [Allosphingosinicella sp.]|nr:RHS repeat-associated core domain-containing protein [Allosphingosinicella sp.]